MVELKGLNKKQYKHMNTQHYLTSATQALLASTLILALVVMGYFFIEPQVGLAVTTSTFSVSQDITGETSFLVLAPNVTMTGSLNGITGGTSNGSTTVVVQTNAVNGYTMNIAFYDNVGSTAMRGQVTGSQSISDYPASTTQPSITFSTASSAAVFGFTVGAASTTDLDASFLNNGSVCNTGSTYTADSCWMTPTTTAFQVIDRGSSATDGATSTIYFRVHVPNNPTPGLVVDTYTATATLTIAPK